MPFFKKKKQSDGLDFLREQIDNAISEQLFKIYIHIPNELICAAEIYLARKGYFIKADYMADGNIFYKIWGW